MFLNKHVPIILLVLLVVGSFFPADAAPKPKDIVEEDFKALQGIWITTEIEASGLYLSKQGKKNQPVNLGGLRFDKDEVFFGDNSLGHLKIDPSKTPKQLDLTSKDGGLTVGIYRLQGDSLTIAWPMQGLPDRPTEFKTVRLDKTGLRVLTLKREKPREEKK